MPASSAPAENVGQLNVTVLAGEEPGSYHDVPGPNDTCVSRYDLAAPSLPTKNGFMPIKKSEALPTAKSISDYVTKNTSKEVHSGMMMRGDTHHSTGAVSMREADYKDHKITVQTTYHIEVDGRPVTGHIDVSNEGTIAYHGLPNMSFDSTVDLVKMLIDQFPNDFPLD